jgi:hypothetical protein
LCVERAEEGPWQLFDLAAGPGERNDLNGEPNQAPILVSLQRRLHEFFDAYADPMWNLWKPDGIRKHYHTKERPKRP